MILSKLEPKFNLVLLQKYIHTYTQHKWVKPNPIMTVCLANCQRAKLFVKYSSTRRKKKERPVSSESATRVRTVDGTDKKRRRARNARRNGKPDGQTRTSGEWRATKRENGTDYTEVLGGRCATKRENGTAWRKRPADGARRNGKMVRTRRKRRAGSMRRDGKPG